MHLFGILLVLLQAFEHFPFEGDHAVIETYYSNRSSLDIACGAAVARASPAVARGSKLVEPPLIDV